MTEPLSLVEIRREQRRVAALLNVSKQFGVVLPNRRHNIPLEDLYKSKYYLQIQAGVKQMYNAGSLQTSVSMPEMKRQGNDANNVWTPDTNVRKSTTASLESTHEGWKHLRETREKRESISKRNQFRKKYSTRSKHHYEGFEGIEGWSPPDQAARELWTRKKIKSEKETGDLTGRKVIEKSGWLQPVGLSDRVINQAGNADYRFPRLAKLGPSQKDPSACRSTTEDADYSGENTQHSSVTEKPLLRYNHGNKGQGMNLSQQGHLDDLRSNRTDASYDWSIYSDSPDDRYLPFYPKTPSASPASLDSVKGFNLTGLGPGMDLNDSSSEVQHDPNQVANDGEGLMGTTDCLDPSGNQGLKHMRWYGGAESMLASADTVMKLGKDTSEPPYSILNTTKNGGISRSNTTDQETSLNPYRDAYVRALAVARSRQLPDDFTGFGTRTTRAFSFSYFAHHRSTCKCQKCLERVLRDSPMKKPIKKRKPPQGLKLILGDIKMDDYYK